MEASGLIQTYQFGAKTFNMARCATVKDIRQFIAAILSQGSLPSSKNALILIKPNLNNDLNALTGNSTDLRILVALIDWLKGNGYGNIVIADGHNVGVDRRNINVFRRLRVDALAKRYGIRFVNLNRDGYREISIAGQKIRVAATALEADFFLNLPKIKTHAEAKVSLSLKNMIGCVVGQDKRKIHRDLSANIVRLNEFLSPNLHIADGLIAMEGNGPGDGRPVRLDLLLSGTDPFLMDLLCARLMGIDWREVEVIKIAQKKGYIEKRHIEQIERTVPVWRHLERPPSRHALTKFADLRLTYPLKRLLRPITSAPLVARMAYRHHIIQDLYDLKDDDIDCVVRETTLCRKCGKCTQYCPMEIEQPRIGEIPSPPECIRCLYCYFVCPGGAIQLHGSRGFLSGIIDRYQSDIRSAVAYDQGHDLSNIKSTAGESKSIVGLTEDSDHLSSGL